MQVNRESRCPECGRAGVEVTVTFDRHDPVSVLRMLGEACDQETLRIAAKAILSQDAAGPVSH